MSKKKDVIEAIYSNCLDADNFDFDNAQVKRISSELGFGNAFDATKIDTSRILPPILVKNDQFIIHLGNGVHRFVSGISFGYHHFEDISEGERLNWNYRKSILNEFDTSESNILSVASNQRILHDFLYDDIVANPKVYGSRRTKASFNYFIGDQTITTRNLQIEIDLTLELQGKVTIVEGKNGFPTDFAIYQLFHPYMYYRENILKKKIPVTEINCCYICRKVLKGNTILRLYNYTFDSVNMESIRLLKKADYQLIRR